MTKLFLHALHLDPYLPNLACAYIYYGNTNNPLNHQKHKIGMFSGDKQESEAFVNHLGNKVIPLLNQGKLNKTYRAIEVNFVNNAPHPVISIMRHDKAIINNDELKQIEKLINQAIQPSNKKHHSLFKEAEQQTVTKVTDEKQYLRATRR